jgi:hypothetical protein
MSLQPSIDFVVGQGLLSILELPLNTELNVIAFVLCHLSFFAIVTFKQMYLFSNPLVKLHSFILY